MAIFYGVYIADEVLAASLDLIRYLSEPDYFRRTHVTVRGPYERHLSKLVERRLSRAFEVNDRSLVLTEVGSFFFGSQNTVLLWCDFPGVRDIWKKPNFPEGKPHITIYDGKSRSFAFALRSSLGKFRWGLQAGTSELLVLEKKRDPQQYLKIYFDAASKLWDEQFAEFAAFQELTKLSELDRLVLINRVCDFLHKRRKSTARSKAK